MALNTGKTSSRPLAHMLLALIGFLATSAVLATGFHATGDAMIALARAHRHLRAPTVVGAIIVDQSAGRKSR